MGIIKNTFGVIANTIIFVVVLALVNIANIFINSVYFDAVVAFLNGSVKLIFTLLIIYFFADMFRGMRYPFSLPAPLFRAVGAAFTALFAVRIMIFFEELINFSINIQAISNEAMLITFVIALIMGYARMLMAKKTKKSKTR